MCATNLPVQTSQEAGGWPALDEISTIRIGKEQDLLMLLSALADASLAPNNGSQPC